MMTRLPNGFATLDVQRAADRHMKWTLQGNCTRYTPSSAMFKGLADRALELESQARASPLVHRMGMRP